MRRQHLPLVQARDLAAAVVIGATVALIAAGAAHAAGSGMSWEAPLQRILESIEGPVTKVIAVVIIIVTGYDQRRGQGRHRPYPREADRH